MPSGVGTEVLFVFIVGCCSMAAAEIWPAIAKRQERMPNFMLIKVQLLDKLSKRMIFK
jgi:hypothetical protein